MTRLDALLRPLLPSVSLGVYIPNLEVGEFELAGDRERGFQLSADVTWTWASPWGLSGQAELSATLSASAATGGEQERLVLELSSPALELELATGVLITGFKLEFSFDFDARAWTVLGSVSARVLDLRVDGLAPRFDGGKLAFAKTFDPERVLLRLEQLATLVSDGLELSVSKPEDDWVHEIRGSGTLRALEIEANKWLINAKGALGIQPDPKRFELDLGEAYYFEQRLVHSPPLPQPIDFIVRAPKFTVAKGEGWSFEASTTLELRGLPEFVSKYLIPAEIEPKLTISKSSVSLSVSPLTPPYELTLPRLRLAEDLEVDLGKLGALRLQATKLELQLAKQSTLTAILSIGLPERLNQLFGVDPNTGVARHEIFRTYDSARPDETMVQLEFGLGQIKDKDKDKDKDKASAAADSKLGAIFRLAKGTPSPLYALEIVDNALVLRLGALGVVHLSIPTFSFEDGKASAKNIGWEFKETPSLPLGPLKDLLRRVEMSEVAKLLPDKVPILDFLELFDAEGKLRVRALLDHLEEIVEAIDPRGADRIMRAIEPALKELANIANLAERLPTALKPYLNFSFPKKFSLAVEIDGKGGFTIKLSLSKDSPARVLWPQLVGIVPMLQGVTLRSFSFGTLMAGQLFTMSIDADFDQFDLSSLGVAVIGGSDLTPHGQEIQRRLIVKKLETIIIYQTKIPIVIPLFYDRLEINSMGIEGVRLRAAVEFSPPKLDPVDILRMFARFMTFASDPNYRLPITSDHDLRFRKLAVGERDQVWAINAKQQLLRYTASPSDAWQPVAGVEAPLGIGVGVDGTAWAIDKDQRVLAWRYGKLWDLQAGQVWTGLSVAGATRVVGRDPQGGGHRLRESGEFEALAPVPGGGARQFAIAADGSIVALSSGDKRPYRYTAGSWAAVDGPTLEQIAIASDAHMAGLDGAGVVQELAPEHGPGWRPVELELPTGERVAAVELGADGSRWLLGDEGGLFRWTGEAWQHENPEHSALRGFKLDFRVCDVYVELPKYLAGDGQRLLGTEGVVFELEGARAASALLNAIKFLSLNDLIQVVALRYRAGVQKAGLGPLKAELRWLLTTPREFRAGAWRELDIEHESIADYLALVPRGSEAQGVVALLQGDIEIPGVLGFHAAFGTIIVDGRGFRTHARLAGKIRGLLDAELNGEIILETKHSPRLELRGDSKLYFAGLEVFKAKGALLIEPERFELAGDFELLPGQAALNIRADIKGSLGRDGLYLQGEASATLGFVQLADASLKILARESDESPGVWVAGKFLGAELSFSVVDEERVRLRMEIEARLWDWAKLAGALVIDRSRPTPTLVTQLEAVLGPVEDPTFKLLLAADTGAGTASMRGWYRDLELLSGDIQPSRADALVLAGSLKLPAQDPLIEASFTGSLANESFTLDGELTKMDVLPGIMDLAPSASAKIDKDGARIDLKFFDATIAEVALVRREDWLSLGFELALGALRLKPTLDFGPAGSQGTFVGEIPGLVGVHATLSLGAGARGTANIDVLGSRLVEAASFTAADGQLEVRGTLALALGPLASFEAKIREGGIGRKGLNIAADAQTRTGIEGVVDVVGAGATNLDDTGLSASLRIQGRVLGHGLEQVGAAFGFKRWHFGGKERDCLMLAWEFPLPVFYGHRTHRLAIATDGAIFDSFFHTNWTDDGWPQDVVPTGAKLDALAAAPSEGGFQEVETALISEVANALLLRDWSSSEPRPDFDLAFVHTMARNGMSTCVLPTQGPEDERLIVLVFHRLECDAHLFRYLERESPRRSLELDWRKLSFQGRSHAGRLFDGRLSLLVRVGEREEELSVPYDPLHPHDALINLEHAIGERS